MSNTTATKINPHLVMVTKVSVTETIKAIPPGESATFSCGELASYSSIVGRLWKLNSKIGRKEYSVSSTDNGATYTITRSL